MCSLSSYTIIANYVASQDRPFVIKSLVTIGIPLSVRDGCNYGKVQAVIRDGLKKTLHSVYP